MDRGLMGLKIAKNAGGYEGLSKWNSEHEYFDSPAELLPRIKKHIRPNCFEKPWVGKKMGSVLMK